MEVPLNIDVNEIFPAGEGSINQYSGQIGSGKTYAATADILELLKNGHVVYANWQIKFDGFDERNDRWLLFLRWLGFKIKFDEFPKGNFHYIPPEEWTTEFISGLTDCDIFLDEGHNYLNSYEKTNVNLGKLNMVYMTRHFNRTLNIISQRQTAIHVSARANVNRFYVCEKDSFLFLWTIFYKREFQEVSGDERVDVESEPVSVKRYFPKQKIFDAYDTRYLRGESGMSQKNLARQWIMGREDAWRRLRRRK